MESGGYIALAMQGAGAGTSAVGSYYGAKSERSNLEFESDMASINAGISEISAQQALSRGKTAQESHLLSTARFKSSQKAALAASGVDIGVGSAAEMLTSTDVLSEIDLNILKENAMREAFGYRSEGVNYKTQAIMSKASAKGISPSTSFGTSLLSSAGSIASSWYMLDKAGVLS